MWKAMLQIGLKKFLWLTKLKILCHGHMLLVILTVKIFLERFMKKNFKWKIKKSWKSNKKGHKLYVKWKGYDHYFSSWSDKTDIV